MAMRWRAVILSFLPIVLSALRLFGVDWAEADAVLIADGLLWIVVFVMYLWGFARAKFNKENKLGKFAEK